MIGAITAGLFGTGVPPVTNSYESIQTYVVGSGGQSDITFTTIPSTYKHLQIRGIVKSSAGGTEDLRMQLNSVTSNYAVHGLYGTGSGTPTANSGTSQAAIVQPYNVVVYNGATSIFGAVIFDILDYANTNKYKTVRTLGGCDLNGSGTIGLYSGLFQDTTAISSIKLFPANNNFSQYSSFALYGIRG